MRPGGQWHPGSCSRRSSRRSWPRAIGCAPAHSARPRRGARPSLSRPSTRPTSGRAGADANVLVDCRPYLAMSSSRRQRILDLIARAEHPITGTELATTLGVSRQIVVQDMAILRAAGADIVATPRGYLRATPRGGRATYREVLAVQHPREMIEAELNALADVKAFMARLADAEPLSVLTRGVHLHTVESSRRGAIDEGRQALRELGIL